MMSEYYERRSPEMDAETGTAFYPGALQAAVF